MSSNAKKTEHDKKGLASGQDRSDTREAKKKVQYEYTKLTDVGADTIINLYGVVKYFKKPFKTASNEFCCTLSLVDPSVKRMEDSLKCVLFGKQSEDELPPVQNVGDIIRFHRLNISTYKGDLQGTSKKGFSWLVFDGRQSAPIEPKSSHENYSYSDRDTEIVQELKAWASQQPELTVSLFKRPLSDLKPNNQFGNIIGQAVAIYTFPENEKCAMIRLWDGTELTITSFHPRPLDDANVNVSLKLLKITKDKTIDVYVFDNHVKEAAKIKPGDFIIARNVHCKRVDDQSLETAFKNGCEDSVDDGKTWAELIIHTGTAFGRGISVLSSSDPDLTEVKERIRLLVETWDAKQKSKITSAMPKEPGTVRAMEESCSVTMHPFISFTLIKDIKSFPSVPYKFRCRVKVFHYFPPKVEDFVCINCNNCKQNSDLTDEVISKLRNFELTRKSDKENKLELMYCEACQQELDLVFVFLLIVADESGMLEIIVFGDDAKYFLDNCSPSLLIRDNKVKDVVQSKIDALVGEDENVVDYDSDLSLRPYFECCVKSYKVFDSDTQTDLIKYQLFDTMLS